MLEPGIHCNVSTLYHIGTHTFRVLYRNQSSLAYHNRFALMTKLEFHVISKTLLLAMPFNIYEPSLNPMFGMSQQLMPVITQHWLTYKVVLCDKFGNPLLRPYDRPSSISHFKPLLVNTALDRDLSLIHI